ncbi:MAG: PEP-CTERM sorting domain-containing protein [Bryobacter sp.]|nr:PEP-CTERM sorting domain-containing protein [Bryobacter sp.]
MKIRSVLAALAFAAIHVASAHAAVIYTPLLGNTTASVLTNNVDFTLLDVRGAAGGSLSNSTTVFLLDSTNGTDPDYQTLAFGNLVLAAIADGPDIANLTFDAGSLQLSNNTLTVNVSGSLLQDTNGSLGPILGGPFLATFALTSLEEFDQNGTFLAKYELTDISTIPTGGDIPEPTTMALMGLALPALVLYGRRRRQ